MVPNLWVVTRNGDAKTFRGGCRQFPVFENINRKKQNRTHSSNNFLKKIKYQLATGNADETWVITVIFNFLMSYLWCYVHIFAQYFLNAFCATLCLCAKKKIGGRRHFCEKNGGSPTFLRKNVGSPTFLRI